MAEDDALRTAAENYRRLVAERPEYFVNPDPDGVVVLTGGEGRREAEAAVATALAAAGRPREWARAGVFYEDAWIYALRDVVRFPDGRFGTHHRIIHKGGPNSVAILPRFEGRFVLIRHFRHGLRDWTYEFPRGGADAGKSAEETARDEVREELGGTIVSLRPFGLVYPQNNLMMTRIRMFFAELSAIGEANRGEGIAELKPVTLAELERLIAAEAVSDSTSVALYTRARLAGLL